MIAVYNGAIKPRGSDGKVRSRKVCLFMKHLCPLVVASILSHLSRTCLYLQYVTRGRRGTGETEIGYPTEASELVCVF